jgi:hypothetical protein
MIGSLAAGAWCLGFAYWFGLSGTIFWAVGTLGFLLVAAGMFLMGTVIGDALVERRQRRGHKE